MWKPRRLTNLLASTACYKNSFTFLRNIHHSTTTKHDTLRINSMFVSQPYIDLESHKMGHDTIIK
jgi:hypothetical protein